jgi:hypothetical protein
MQIPFLHIQDSSVCLFLRSTPPSFSALPSRNGPATSKRREREGGGTEIVRLWLGVVHQMKGCEGKRTVKTTHASCPSFWLCSVVSSTVDEDKRKTWMHAYLDLAHTFVWFWLCVGCVLAFDEGANQPSPVQGTHGSCPVSRVCPVSPRALCFLCSVGSPAPEHGVRRTSYISDLQRLQTD